MPNTCFLFRVKGSDILNFECWGIETHDHANDFNLESSLHVPRTIASAADANLAYKVNYFSVIRELPFDGIFCCLQSIGLTILFLGGRFLQDIEATVDVDFIIHKTCNRQLFWEL